MNVQALRQKRAAAIDAANGIVNAAIAEERGLTDEEQTQVDSHMAEANRLEATIDRAVSVATANRGLEEPTASPVSRVPTLGAPVPPAGKDPKSGFSSLGEFVATVRFNPRDDRLKQLAADPIQQMDVGEAGGFNVPREFLPDLLKVNPGEALVRPRATVIPAGTHPDAGVDIPALDQNADTSNVYGGVTVGWIAEGGAKPKTAAGFKQVKLDPHEVAAHVDVTDKLLRNWGAAELLITDLLRGAIIAAEDSAFIRGDGVGKPTGFLTDKNTSAIKINRETANTISWVDTLMMEEAAKGENLIYVASRKAKTVLSQIKDDADRFIYREAQGPIPATLNGTPLVVHDSMAGLGDLGDLVLVDLSYYLIKDGFGIAVAASPHVEFRNNITVIKAFTNVDGKSWLTAPYKTAGGDTVSPYVFLDVPEAGD